MGFKLALISFLVPASSLGILLILYAPARMLYTWAWLNPLRPERILATSLPESMSRRRVGGAKSRAVKVPDLRSKCLEASVSKLELNGNG